MIPDGHLLFKFGQGAAAGGRVVMPNLDTSFGNVVSGQQLTRVWSVVSITGAEAGLRRSGRGGGAYQEC
jgi:hypothetical protein